MWSKTFTHVTFIQFLLDSRAGIYNLFLILTFPFYQMLNVQGHYLKGFWFLLFYLQGVITTASMPSLIVWQKRLTPASKKKKTSSPYKQLYHNYKRIYYIILYGNSKYKTQLNSSWEDLHLLFYLPVVFLVWKNYILSYIYVLCRLLFYYIYIYFVFCIDLVGYLQWFFIEENKYI